MKFIQFLLLFVQNLVLFVLKQVHWQWGPSLCHKKIKSLQISIIKMQLEYYQHFKKMITSESWNKCKLSCFYSLKKSAAKSQLKLAPDMNVLICQLRRHHHLPEVHLAARPDDPFSWKPARCKRKRTNGFQSEFTLQLPGFNTCLRFFLCCCFFTALLNCAMKYDYPLKEL